MNHKVHHLAGVVTAEILLVRYQVPLLSFTTLFATFGGYILGQAADLDTEESSISQHYPLRAVARLYDTLRFKHRGFTHSFLFIGLLYLICKLLFLPDILCWAFVLSYATHPFLDLFNEQGVQLFWPIPIRIKLLPSLLAVSSDERSFVQSLLSVALVGVFWFLTADLLIHTLEFVPWIGPALNRLWDNYVMPEVIGSIEGVIQSIRGSISHLF